MSTESCSHTLYASSFGGKFLRKKVHQAKNYFLKWSDSTSVCTLVILVTGRHAHQLSEDFLKFVNSIYCSIIASIIQCKSLIHCAWNDRCTCNPVWILKFQQCKVKSWQMSRLQNYLGIQLPTFQSLSSVPQFHIDIHWNSFQNSVYSISFHCISACTINSWNTVKAYQLTTSIHQA